MDHVEHCEWLSTPTNGELWTTRNIVSGYSLLVNCGICETNILLSDRNSEFCVYINMRNTVNVFVSSLLEPVKYFVSVSPILVEE